MLSPEEIREQEVAHAEALGAWAIVRKGRRHLPPRVRRFPDEVRARRAWSKIDVREGYAALLDPAGAKIDGQSGPFAVRTRW